MGPEDLLGHGSKSDSMSSHLAGMKLPKGMRICQSEKTILATAGAGSRAALGPRDPSPGTVLHLGWGGWRTDSASTMACGDPAVIVIIITAVPH